MRRIPFLLILLLSLSSVALAGERVMFIGNSLTGFNNLPAQVLEQARGAGFEPEIEEYIAFGQTLDFQSKRKDVIDALTKREWDVVVLQEYSVLPIERPDEFEKSVMKIERLIRSGPSGANTRVLLFQNWPLRGKNTIQALDDSYAKVSSATGVEISPIGRAWNEARTLAGAELYVDDRHPSPLGTYLAAATIAKSIFKINADSLDYRGSNSTTPGTVSGRLAPVKFYDLDRDVDPAILERIQAIVDSMP